ncbi:hypothetical protein [Nocardia sp. NPDC048505]
MEVTPFDEGKPMLNLVAVPTNPLDGLLRVLSQLVCTISSGGNCAVIQ